MRTGNNNEAGFTLAELMVCIGIIGLLTMLVQIKVRQMWLTAYQTEAELNIKQLRTLADSYVLENDDYPDASECGETSTILGATYCVLSRAQDTNCNVDNPFGWEIANCDDARYEYWYLPILSGTKGIVYALSNNARIGCGQYGTDPHGWRDRWAANSCGRYVHYVQVEDPYTCSVDTSLEFAWEATNPNTGNPYIYGCEAPP